MKLVLNWICTFIFSVTLLLSRECTSFHLFPLKKVYVKPPSISKTVRKMSTLHAVIPCQQNDFDQTVLKSEIPVLVDFYANWCGPCKMMSPILEQLALEWEGKLKIVKVDADDAEDLVETYQVQGLPTFALFLDGRVAATFAGAVPKERLKQFVSKELQKKNLDFA